MAAKTYTALTPIEHDGKPFAEGSTIELTDEQAAQLLELRAVELSARKTQRAPRAPKADGQADGNAEGQGGEGGEGEGGEGSDKPAGNGDQA